MLIAEEYQIPGYDDPLVDVLFLVKTWLEKKDTEPWLMILDDADDMELCFGSPRGVSLGSFELKKESKLFNYLPENRYGDLIITTRNHQLAIRLARGQNIIQVGNMSVDESEELLRAKLDNISESSADLSLLSSQLGFLPLALSQAAFYIQKAGITPSKYFELLVKHEQNTAQLLSEEVETAVHDLPTSWGFQDTIILSLELLEQQNPLASEILLFISLLDPENIPTEFLLHYTKQKRNQESINDIKLMDALGALEASCLIIGSKNRGYGIHRLIQGILRKWLTDSGKIGQFRKEVLMVVSSLYPQGGYETRTVCAAYLPHAYAILQSGDFTLNDELEAKASLLHCIATYLNFEGKWDNAESLALEAMQIRQELFGEYDISTLTSMANLASISYNHGRWEEAEQLQAIIMEKRKTKLGADHPDTLNSMSNLAIIYGNQGRYEQAEQLERQVTEILNIKLGADHPDTLNSMSNLATIYRNQGRYEQAEQLEVRVMEGLKIKLGADHPDTLNSMSDLAIIYRNQGRYEQAEQLEVRVMESLKIKFGADHPNTLASMTTLARIYRKQGRWDAAEQLEVQIMESLKTKLGDNHLLTLRSMANLATIYWKQGQWDEAEKLLVQVMELRENNLGADHPDTLTSMTTLAAIYRDQGRLEKAEQFNIQASEKIKTTLGAEHPDTLAILTNLASIYSDQGRFADAEKLERQVMEISKNKLGADHPSTLKSLANLASTYESQGRWKEAETLNVQAMEGFKTKLGIDHPDTLSSMSNLAAVYRHQDRWEEAKELLLRVTETRELYLGSDHPDTLTGLANLATIYDDQGLWADAELLLIRVSGALRRVLGEKHPRTLGALGNLASTFRQHGRLEEAEELFVQVIQTKKEVLGEMHPETLSSTTELALVLEANDRYLEARDYLQHVLELQQQCLGPQHTNTTNTRSLMERIVQEIERPQRPWTEKSNSTSSEPPGTFWSAADSSSDPTEQSIEDPSADILNNKKFFPMTFFNYKLLEPGLELYQPLDDVESIASIEDDIQSLDGSSSDTALAAVSYITKMFVDNPELFGLYHEATKIFGEAKFIRSHRRLLKKFYLDLVPESRTPQQHVAIDFLRSRVARIRISQSIYRILKPLDRTNREKVNAILEQETDDMFLLERHLVGIGPIEQGIQASIPDGTVPDDEEVADDIDVSSQSSSEASSLDVSGHDDHSFQTLKSIGEFLTLSESFNLYKRNVRNFLYSPPKVQKGDYILRNNMVLSALSRQQPSLEEAKSRNSPAKATGPSHMETNETGKKLYNIPEKKHGRNLKEIPNESVNWGFLKLFQAWLRPSPCPGRQRITWKSARGKLLYIDIEGASKQEACRIQDSFRRTPITDEQSDMPSAPPDANFPIIPPMAYCRPNTHAGNPPTSFTDSDLGTTLGILSNNPEPGTRMARPCYLLLCVTTRHNTYYQSINITRVLHDQSLFQAIRDEYFNLKSKENQDFWPKSGFLLYLVTFLQSCLKIAEFFTPRSVELVSVCVRSNLIQSVL
jgi:tetratricopeptide (TPR) repeat protein